MYTFLEKKRRKKMVRNDDESWYTIESDELSQCFSCGHQSYEHAEHDDLITDKETGEHDVFCPKCKSDLYFIAEEDERDWIDE